MLTPIKEAQRSFLLSPVVSGNVPSTGTYLRSGWQSEDLMGFIFLNDNYLSCRGTAVAGIPCLSFQVEREK